MHEFVVFFVVVADLIYTYISWGGSVSGRGEALPIRPACLSSMAVFFVQSPSLALAWSAAVLRFLFARSSMVMPMTSAVRLAYRSFRPVISLPFFSVGSRFPCGSGFAYAIGYQSKLIVRTCGRKTHSTVCLRIIRHLETMRD